MPELKVQKQGGQATAIILRNKALDAYYKNPKYCKQCSKVIEVGSSKASEIRKKNFCDRSCSAIYNNLKRVPIEDRNPKNLSKLQGKKNKRLGIIKEVKEIRPDFYYLLGKTKGKLFEECKNWQSARTCIRRHAAYVYKNNGGGCVCNKCGYDKHIEICHIKSVSSFVDESLIQDINSISNLIGLCPNCHWEFDNNLLDL